MSLSQGCRNALCAPIRFYQRFISPGLGRSCRFSPSCSQYTLEAIQTHGCLKGLLLGAARILKDMEDQLPGTVKLMFQPGEEMGYGSRTMVEDGLLENPKVDAAMALHV